MMISVESFMSRLVDATYAELIQEKNDLIRDIFEYERNQRQGISNAEVVMCPSPEVVYQMNLEYLSALLKLMRDRFQEDIVMVNKESVEEQLTFIRNVIWQGNAQYLSSAKQMLNELVKNENAEAMNIKGAMYAEGQCLKQNSKRAFEWYMRSANLGCSLAMSNVGFSYYHGKGTAIDYDKAFMYFSMAAQRGEWDAYVALGDMYRYGHCVPEDYKMAFYFYDKCFKEAEHSENNDAYPACLSRLGECFHRGHGVEVNLEIAGNLLDEALRIYEMQLQRGNVYAAEGIQKARLYLKILIDEQV